MSQDDEMTRNATRATESPMPLVTQNREEQLLSRLEETAAESRSRLTALVKKQKEERIAKAPQKLIEEYIRNIAEAFVVFVLKEFKFLEGDTYLLLRAEKERIARERFAALLANEGEFREIFDIISERARKKVFWSRVRVVSGCLIVPLIGWGLLLTCLPAINTKCTAIWMLVHNVRKLRKIKGGMLPYEDIRGGVRMYLALRDRER